VIARRFTAMGCEVAVASSRPEEVSAARRLFDEWERTFSRFRADSELNRVNARAGSPVLVSDLFARAVEVALNAAEETGGLVDPTLARALEGAGYVADFDEIVADARPARPGPPGAWRSLTCRGRLISFPRHVRLDLNGVVKALTIDTALTLLRHGWFVSAGGDVAVRSPLAVELPGGGTIELRKGALATSGSVKRRWLRGGEVQHHLIDPRSGRPAVSPWQQVTVCGSTCVAADVAAKAAFIAGESGPEWLDARRLPGRFLDQEGEVVVNESWRRSMARAVACT
jgi:FAD:protein FMN transferase